MQPEILVVIRASPIRERTVTLLQTIASQGPPGSVRTVVLSPWSRAPERQLGLDDIDEIPADADWGGQVLSLVKDVGCRLVVFPSYVDRYLSGVFRSIAEFPAGRGRSIVGPCRIRLNGQTFPVGPQPFRFDYFSLLCGFNWIAPGATFIDARTFVEVGGFDPRFPHAATFEYLLRTGAGDAVASYASPLVETEADPFPGVAPEYGPFYALEAAAATLTYYRFMFTPGAALGLMAMLTEHLLPPGSAPGYDERLRYVFASMNFKEEYLRAVSPVEARPPARAPKVSADLRIGSRIKAVAPTPIWNLLRRCKRGWGAFRDPGAP